MNKGKRQLDINQPFDDERKKLRKTFNKENKVMTCMEILSNEIFYEIFEYLDGCDMFRAFSNLNCRFESLLDGFPLLLKIKLRSETKLLLEYNSTHIVIPNKYRIISLGIISYEPNYLLYNFFTIDTLFSCLESLILYNIPTNKFESVLINLYALPRLFSLTICHYDRNIDVTDVFLLLFALPLLKYCKVSFNSCRKILLPLVLNKRTTSSIKHLVVRKTLTIKELTSLISYAPQLHRLTCKNLVRYVEFINQGTLISPCNLTHIFIDSCDVRFDDFEIFITKVSSQLQVLRITTSSDLAYLDADRWERLILKYLSHLRIFDFQHQESINNDLRVAFYHRLINRFNSSFWIERQWLLEIKIDINIRMEGLIIYSISPAKKKFYNFSSYVVNQKTPQNMIQHGITTNGQDLTSDTIQLTLVDLTFMDCIYSLMNLISPILIQTHITRLVVTDYEISIDMLSKFINHLPHLTSLIVWCLSSLKIIQRIVERRTVHARLNDNQIVNIHLEKLTELEHLESLIGLCPRMKYLQIIDIKHVDLQSLIQLILRKHGKEILHDFTLCIKNYQLDDKMIQQLQEIINIEKLNNSCTIACAYGHFYVECKY